MSKTTVLTMMQNTVDINHAPTNAHSKSELPNNHPILCPEHPAAILPPIEDICSKSLHGRKLRNTYKYIYVDLYF